MYEIRTAVNWMTLTPSGHSLKHCTILNREGETLTWTMSVWNFRHTSSTDILCSVWNRERQVTASNKEKKKKTTAFMNTQTCSMTIIISTDIKSLWDSGPYQRHFLLQIIQIFCPFFLLVRGALIIFVLRGSHAVAVWSPILKHITYKTLKPVEKLLFIDKILQQQGANHSLCRYRC